MNSTIPTPTPTTLTPTLMAQVIIPALDEVVMVDHDDVVKTRMLSVQQAVNQRAEQVMTRSCGHLQNAFYTLTQDSKAAVRDMDKIALHQALAKFIQSTDIYSIRFLKCFSDKDEANTTFASLMSPVPMPVLLSTGGTSTPSASNSSRTSPRKRKRVLVTCHGCGKNKKCYPRLGHPNTFNCRRCGKKLEAASKRPRKVFQSGLWTPLEEEHVVTMGVQYAEPVWSKPPTMTRNELAAIISEDMISKGMLRTQRAVYNRLQPLGLIPDLTMVKLNLTLKARLIETGLIAPPLPPSTGDDANNDISMTPAPPSTTTDAKDMDYVQASSDDDDDDDAETYDAEDDKLVEEGDLEVLARAIAHDVSLLAMVPTIPTPTI